MRDDLDRALHAACVWMPEVEAVTSHGMTTFRVRGKTFVYVALNHHGDGRVALWLNAPPGAQEGHVAADPDRYFVPSYVGGRGWLGLQLNKGLAWKRVAAHVRTAYETTAPAPLAAALGKTPMLEAPARLPDAAAIDPLRSARGAALLAVMRGLCTRLPECREAVNFGAPVWQAGKKTFVWLRHQERRFTFSFWVGVDRQQLLTHDERYRIPAYLGPNGWIDLDVSTHCDPDEVADLTLQSYRHFALQRMLRLLDSPAPAGGR